jgi:HSP20 family protein
MAENTEMAAQQRQDMETTRGWERHLRPPVDIYETPDELVLMADMPGVSGDNLEVNIEDGVLTVRGKPALDSRGEPIFREFELATFFRQFQLGTDIDTDKVQARLKSGVAELHLPKSERAKPKRIPVQMQ